MRLESKIKWKKNADQQSHVTLSTSTNRNPSSANSLPIHCNHLRVAFCPKIHPRSSVQATSLNTVPHGFTIGTTPDGKEYLVPSHMVPVLDQAFISYHTKIKIGVATSSGRVSYWYIQSPHCWMSCRSYDSSMSMWSLHPIYCLLTIILVWTGSEHPIWQDHPSQNPLPSRPCMSSHRSSCIDLMALQQLTDHKLLTLHSEVLTLQQKLSIWYKDASHCLYTCKIEKLALADANHKAFKNLDSHLEQYLMDLNECLWPQTDASSNSNQW